MNTRKTTLSPLQQIAAAAGAVAAVLALSALTGAAFAADAPPAGAADVPTAVVRYDAASLETERGTREVYRRIVSAARAVCPDENTRDLGTLNAVRECQKAAIARAVSRIHHPHLVEVAAHDKRI